jgi:hypothetical protein
MDLAASVHSHQSTKFYYLRCKKKSEGSINMPILVSSRTYGAILNKDGKPTFYYTSELLAYMDKKKLLHHGHLRLHRDHRHRRHGY